MKNNDNDQIKIHRQTTTFSVASDILVVPKVVEANMKRMAERPKHKRRIDYAKKIINDPFLFNA